MKKVQNSLKKVKDFQKKVKYFKYIFLKIPPEKSTVTTLCDHWTQ